MGSASLTEIIIKQKKELKMSNDFVMLKSTSTSKKEEPLLKEKENKEEEKDKGDLFKKYLEPVLCPADFPTLEQIFNRFYEGTLIPLLLASIKQNSASINVTVPMTANERAVYLDRERQSSLSKIDNLLRFKIDDAGLKKCHILVCYIHGGSIEVTITRNHVAK